MIKKPLYILGFLTLFFFIWQWSATTFAHLMFILPPPLEIFKTVIELRARFWLHTSVTLKEMCCGFLLALTFAFPLAWTMMRYKTSRSILQPLFIIIQCIPMFALAPIMVVWFGWGYMAIIMPTALMIFFPLTLNVYQGLKGAPSELIEFFQANQATPWQTFYKLRLPWAIPHIFAGFRISAAIAGVSAVAGEWAGAQNGLGILMLESRRNTDLEITFGALFCLAAISTLLYLVILYCEKMALPPRRWGFFLPRQMISQNFLRKKRLALPFLLLLILTTSCQNPSEEKTRLLLDWLPNPNHIPLYVGLEKGYFKEEGINLVIQKMHEGGGGISYLVSQKADLLVNHMPGTLKACEKGAQLKIVGLLIKQPLCGLTYRDNPAIQKPSDLSNLRFGYCIGLPDIDFLNFLLKQGGIHPAEMKNVSVDLVSAMGTGSVDFIYGGFWNIEPAQLQSLGVPTQTFKIQELGVPLYYEMIILANGESFEASDAFVQRFQRALQKSIDDCLSDPGGAFDLFMKYNPDRSLKTSLWQKAAWEVTYPLLASDQNIDPQLIKDFYEWQLKEQILEEPFNYLSLIPLNINKQK